VKAAFIAVLTGLQSLKSEESRETPVDRLAALGAAQIRKAEEAHRLSILTSLGVDLIRYKYARVETAGPDSEDKLSAILAWPSWWTGRKVGLDAIQRDMVACWAIHEWYSDLCPPRPEGCGGALEVPSAAQPIDGAQPMMTCSRCGGTGKRRWTDRERVEAMGDTFGKGMDHAHRIIAFAEDLAMRRGKEMLERW
jgi:hypothetical protein